MNTAFHTLAGVVLFAATGAVALAGPPDEPAKGKVLILDNERTMEGDIERIGSQYRVHRKVGETWVPGDRVLRLCADVPAAYVYLRGRANLNDADERLRLADWCRQHGLREQALAEVQEAVRLRPNNVACRRLLENLQQALPVADAAAKPVAPEPEMPAVPVDLTADAMGLFATKVQPILMNTCAGCHASDKAGKFRLTRSYDSEGGNRRILQQNLTAVLAQVNLSEPRVSPLLTKSVSVHGSLASAPLKNRQSPAYRALEEWVRLTLANNPALRSPAASAQSEARLPITAPSKAESEFAGDAAPRAAESALPATTSVVTPPAQPAAPDPFDPSIFNRQMHPEKQPDQPKKP
jgi:hypothetical protein